LNVKPNFQARPEAAREIDVSKDQRRHPFEARKPDVHRSVTILFMDESLNFIGLSKYNWRWSVRAEAKLENLLIAMQPTFGPEVAGRYVVITGVTQELAEQLDIRS